MILFPPRPGHGTIARRKHAKHLNDAKTRPRDLILLGKAVPFLGAGKARKARGWRYQPLPVVIAQTSRAPIAHLTTQLASSLRFSSFSLCRSLSPLFSPPLRLPPIPTHPTLTSGAKLFAPRVVQRVPARVCPAGASNNVKALVGNVVAPGYLSQSCTFAEFRVVRSWSCLYILCKSWIERGAEELGLRSRLGTI